MKKSILFLILTATLLTILTATEYKGPVQIEGSPAVSASTTPTPGSGNNVFDNIGKALSTYAAGDIAEILLYNSILSDTDRIKVENYLGNKYNL